MQLGRASFLFLDYYFYCSDQNFVKRTTYCILPLVALLNLLHQTATVRSEDWERYIAIAKLIDSKPNMHGTELFFPLQNAITGPVKYSALQL